MTKQIFQSRVLANEQVARDTFLMKVSCPQAGLIAKPGQFVTIGRPFGQGPTLIKRPFSIHRANKNGLELLYKVIGPGTESLRDVRVGENLEVVGPLGNSFPELKQTNIFLLGGGIGVAPMVFCYDRLQANNQLKGLFAVREADYSVGYINDIFDLHVDQIKGYFACDHLEEILVKEKIEILFGCGPMVLMERTVEITRRLGIASYVSLEAYMACGFGACNGCVVETPRGMKRVCYDGPVFKGEELWV